MCSLERYPFRYSAHFSNSFFSWVVCVYWKLAAYQIHNLQNFFSHSVGCLFHLLMLSFVVQKLFSLMFIFACFAFSIGVKFRKKNSHQDLCQRAYHLYFLLSVYGFRSYIQPFNPFWVNIYVLHRTVIQFYSFACGYPAFSTPFIEQAFSIA